LSHCSERKKIYKHYFLNLINPGIKIRGIEKVTLVVEKK